MDEKLWLVVSPLNLKWIICLLAQAFFQVAQFHFYVTPTNPCGNSSKSSQAHHAMRCVIKWNKCCERALISLHISLKWKKVSYPYSSNTTFWEHFYSTRFDFATGPAKYLSLEKGVFLDYPLQRIPPRPLERNETPVKKTTVTSWVSWGCRVRGTASGVGILVVSKVVGCVDIMIIPKGRSIRITSVHCILLILVLC